MVVPLVAVFGSGGAPPDDIDQARRLGRAIAEAGFGVINGGYGGTMEASAAGAREVGGHTVGVTCRAFTFRSGPNPYLQELVEAPDLITRLEILLRRAAAYVVLPGGNGTLIELALTWEHLRKGLSPVVGRPLLAWEVPWRSLVERLEAGPYLDGGAADGIVWVSDPEQAVAEIRRRLL